MARKKSETAADEALVAECHKIFGLCEDAEADTRKLWKEDLRFANGDPDNGYQWDELMLKKRDLEFRPSLTINKVKQHNRQITNDARQNKPSIRVYPVDGGADKKTAEVFNGVIRHIEANSSADTAYDMAGEFAVDAGLGYWRVTTEYASDDSFDQEIFIKPVKNPLNVYLYGYNEPDGSDATRGFVFDDMPKDQFEAAYPDCEPIGWPLDGGTSWLTKDTIRVCEYFKIVEERDTLIAGPDGQTKLLSVIKKEAEEEFGKEAGKAAVEELMAQPELRSRSVSVRKCKWYKVAGDKIIDRKDWAGKYIPIVRVIGDEIEIDGKVDRKGQTRSLKDAQRMYNFWTSSAVEFVALQGKQPYLAPAEAISGHEAFWDNLNTQNNPYVPYNSVDGNGNAIPMPQRQQPPVMAQAYMQGMQIASEEMKMASGQYDASMGAKSNETSGRAIMARQREGDKATFHFIDNVARSIRFTGKILVDLIPKIYDTARVLRILGEDGKEDEAQIDPQQQQSVVEQKDATGAVKEIYNPTVGRYDVTVAVGPSYGTKRQEAFQALTELSSRNPQLMQIAGDIIMRAADFPMAEQLAERLERTVPAELKDDDKQEAPSPEVVQLQEQLKQFSEALTNAAAEVEKLEAEQGDKKEANKIAAEGREVDRFKAETERLKLVIPYLPPEALAEVAASIGLQAATSPDIYTGNEAGPPAAQQPQQPAEAGFLTPQ